MSEALPELTTSPVRLLAAVRVTTLALCAGLMGVTGTPDDPGLWIVGLAVAATIGSLPTPRVRYARGLQPVIETLVAALVISQAGPTPDALLPYLLAPAFAAGLLNGVAWAIGTAAAAQAFLTVAVVVGDQSVDVRDYLGTVGTWGLLSLAVGLLGAWVRRLQEQARGSVADPSYVAAYRLLSQLQIVSRHLSAGLDPVALGQALLQTVRSHIPYNEGAVLVRSPGGRLVPLAVEGAERIDWHTSVRGATILSDAWTTSEPLQQKGNLADGKTGHSVVLPLRFGVRMFGLLAMETSEGPVAPDALLAAMRATNESALPLETALLFADIRSIATTEERRRLAREIHDGIAQELASLGYIVDDLTARARFLPELEQDLKGLRGEVTRLVSELRFSIFDLRSEVASAGLGTTLAEYVRQVGAGSKLTVHLVLDESPSRLRTDTEAELLRIAQEAVTNARKHAGASNLWVTCRVAPPSALLRVEDDGRGLGTARNDSYGMEIMSERAKRIGAELRVAPRDEGGTLVEVSLGPQLSPWLTAEHELEG